MSENPILSDKEKAYLETSLPMWKIVLRQFIEHRMAVAGSLVILFFIAIALLADVISHTTGLDPNAQNVGSRYLQPFSKTEASSSDIESTIEKFVNENPDLANTIQKKLVEQNIVQVPETDSIYELSQKGLVELKKTLTNIAPKESLGLVQNLSQLSQYHVFGTDEVGRDVFIRLIYSTRISLSVGIISAFAAALIGLLVGSIAGFYGGVIDTVLMRITDALLSLPTIPVLIVFAAIDLTKLPALKAFISGSNESLFKMVIILCIFSWMTVALLVRGSILSIREREFVLAAKTLGAKDSTIIFRHMFPNVMAPMMVSISLGIGESILFEAALSFLGLGIMPPTPSWGNMLNNAQEVIYNNIWLAVIPGLMILLTTISFNFIGDGLQDAIDPKSIRR